MKHIDALKIFQKQLDVADLKMLTPLVGVEKMLDFYRTVRFDECPLEEDADMLLFQWGLFDWGDGEFFEIDITRQLIRNADCDDDDIRQLSLKFSFKVTEEPKQIESGNRWCANLNEMDDFAAFAESNAAFSALKNCRAEKVKLDYFCAG